MKQFNLPTSAKRILFFGSDQVSLIALEALRKRELTEHITAVTSPPTQGKPSLVQEFCTKNEIPCTYVKCHQKLNRETFSLTGTAHNKADVSVVVSFRYYLPRWLLSECPPAINMHPSLLPLYRGPGPIFAALRNNCVISGVSIIKITPDGQMDCGDILLQRKMEVPRDMDIRQYFPAITRLGQQCVVEVLDDFNQHWSLAKSQLDVVKPSYAPKLDRGSGKISWSGHTTAEVFGLWRSLVSYYPVFSYFNKLVTPVGARLKDPAKKKPVRIILNEIESPWVSSAGTFLHQARAVTSLAQPGSVFIPENASKSAAIRCADDWIIVTEVTLHGGRRMPITTLLTGFELKPGIIYPDIFFDG